MYLSQGMIALASGLFLPAAMARGLMPALARGPNYILSFIIVFLTTQGLGALLGSAVFGSFITRREQYHSNMLTEGLSLSDPLVAQRIAQLGGAYGRVLTDPALRTGEGVAALGKQATLQANVLAYNDALLVIAVFAALALAALLVHIAYDALKERRAAPPSEA